MFFLRILIFVVIISIIMHLLKRKETKTEEVKEKVVVQEFTHRTLPHCLFYGPAGIGKTTLAKVISNDMSSVYGRAINFHAYTPSVLNTTSDVFDLIQRIKYGDVVFIDEIHGLTREIEESIYGIMQDFVYFYNGNVISIPKFTLLGATTLAGNLNKPLRDRFTILVELDPMTPEELTEVANSKEPEHIKDYVGQEKVKQLISLHVYSINKDDVNELEPIVVEEVAKRSLNNPRILKQIMVHVKAYQRLNGTKIDKYQLHEILDLLSIDKNGLHKPDIRVLKALMDANRPIGLAALANSADVSKEDMEEMIEPRLKRCGFISGTARGRIITEKGILEYGYLRD